MMEEYPAKKAPLFNKKYLIVGVLVLVVVVAFLAYFNRPQDVIEPGAIRIVRGGEVVKNLTLEELQALPRVEVDKTISSSSNPDEAGVFTGAELKEVLQAADPDLLEDCERVFARASDGFVASYDKDEILQADNILVVYAKDGRPLGDAGSGGTGPLRIVVRSDPFGNRCTKHLSELEVE